MQEEQQPQVEEEELAGPPEPEEEESVAELHPRQRRKRKRAPNGPESAQKGAVSAQLDLEEYLDQFNWEVPGMKVKLTRLAPAVVQGVPCKGHVDTKEGAPYALEEIKERYGGGTYRVNVSGPRELGGMIVALGAKTFDVSGPARIDQQISVIEQGAAASPGGSAKNDLAPQAQGALVGLIGKSLDRAYDGRSADTVNPDILREVRESVEASARAQVEAIQRASEERTASIAEQLNELRQENATMRAELKAREQQAAEQVNTARMESSGVLTTLLPSFAEQANSRAEAATRDAAERVARMQEQYARDLQAAEQRFEQQSANLKTLYEAQVMNVQTMWQGRSQQLETEIQLLRTRNEHLEGELNNLRNRNTELLLEQTKKTDPMSIMEQAANLSETAQGLFGGKDEGGGGLSDDASDGLKLVNNMFQSLGSLAPALAARLGAGGGQQPQVPPQQLPPPQARPQPQRVQRPPQAPGQLVPTAITPQPPAKKKVKLNKRELQAGVTMLNSALQSGVAPAVAADTAANTIDRKTLHELTRRKPEVVYASLDSLGMITGPLATEAGSNYLGAFLVALRARLSGAPTEALPDAQEQSGVSEVSGEGTDKAVDSDQS